MTTFMDDGGPKPKKSLLSNEIKHSIVDISLNSLTSSRQLLDLPHESEESDLDEISTNAPSSSNTHSRKEKSLGILCRRFLVTMGENMREGRDVHLETVATRMETEKRRIYDIVNVMEALESMSKTNKSFYKWNTLASLPQLMNTLKNEARLDELPKRIKEVEDAMCSFTELGHNQRDSVGSMVSNNENSSQGSVPFSPVDGQCSAELKKMTPTNLNSSLRDRNGKNSLAQLCRRFLMVLLCNPDDKRKVSLDVASTVLIKEPESEGFEPPSRSRCRRLYDIANVLTAMGLIKKVHYLFGTKKIPLFVYCGPEPCATAEEAKLSMAEFTKRSGLAQPNDSTWIAIFGLQQNKPQLFQNNPVLLKPQNVQPKRRVFGELDPINPRGQSFNGSNSQIILNDSTKPFKKRNFDGKMRVLNGGNKENLLPDRADRENNENILPKPRPQNVPPTTQQFKNKDSANNSTFSNFMSAGAPQFQLMPNFSSIMPNMQNMSNMPSMYQQQANSLNFLAALQWQQLRNVFGANQTQNNPLNIANTAFKPVPTTKAFSGNQVNR